MIDKTFFVFIFLLLSSSIVNAQPCYLVMLGAKDGRDERVRVNSPAFYNNNREGNSIGRSITLFAHSDESLLNIQKTEIEIKIHKTGAFHTVKLNIPDQEGCHLLLVRDRKLRPPYYFRVEWLSQAMMDEYFFGGVSTTLDTSLFTKRYQNSIPLPSVDIQYKGQPLTSQWIDEVKPFHNQLMELTFNITAAQTIHLDPQMKAVEISFVHPDLANIESQYIISNSILTWTQRDSIFFWPKNFTLIPGAKIIVKCLYWYNDGFEIKESGLVTKTIEF
jgi:hypothetical protein